MPIKVIRFGEVSPSLYPTGLSMLKSSFNQWRKIVSSSEEVRKLIVGSDSLSSDHLKEDKNIAILYAKSLFTSMNHQALLDCK